MIRFFGKIRRKLANENRFLQYSRYAIGEIVLVVIGILIALQVNNWNEERLEKKQIEKYARSLINDLENDVEMLQVSMYQAQKIFRKIDSLRHYMAQNEPRELSNTVLFVLSRDLLYRPYIWNRSTLDALKNSGGLRLISNDSISKKLVAYESFSQHLDEDFNGDIVNFEKANDQMIKVLNLNSVYFKRIAQWEADTFNAPFESVFQSTPFLESRSHELPLGSNDAKDLNEFMNRLIIIQDDYRIRGFSEMPEIIDDAHELIELLQNEYIEMTQ